MDRLSDRAALVSAWYAAYFQDAVRLCRFYLGSQADAEDAAQETFLKLWRKLDTFENRTCRSARAWIMKTAGNTCRDHLRKPFRRCEDRTVTPEDLAVRGDVPSADRELRIDLSRLPEEYRTAVMLVYGRGLTVQETAQRIRVSKATVSRRLEKARGMIRRSIICENAVG